MIKFDCRAKTRYTQGGHFLVLVKMKAPGKNQLWQVQQLQKQVK